MIQDHGGHTLPGTAQEPLYRRLWQRSPGRTRSGMRRRGWLVGLALIGCVSLVCGLFYRWHTTSAAALGRQCRILSAHGKWPELAIASAQWARAEPQAADPWLSRAEAAEGLEDWAHVVQYLDRVPRSDSRATAALIRKATVEFENLNRPRDGVKTCDEVLELDPRVLMAHKQPIFFYAMTLQRAEMVRRVRRAIQLRRESPESYVYLVGAHWLYSASLYRHNTHWLESDPQSEIFQVAQALQVYVSEAKSEPQRAPEFEHIPPEEQLLQKYPHNLELVAYFLNRSISEGDLDRVHDLLEAVPFHLADADPRFWRARAWCDDANGDFAAAEKSLRRAFALDPYWWQIHFQLHDLLRRLGRTEESARFFEMYRIAKALAAEIKALTQSAETLNNQKFLQSLLKLAEFAEDDDLASALRDRLSTL